MSSSTSSSNQTLDRERFRILRQFENWLELPMLLLGVVWLILLLLQITRDLNPMLQAFGTVIWAIFIFEFVLRLAVAPRKGAFLTRNWLAVPTILFPPLRMARVFRVVRLSRLVRGVRGLRLFRVVAGLNRAMRALGETMKRRGFGYVLVLTTFVMFAGAGAMLAFERDTLGAGGLDGFGKALWWTGMIMTTMGSEVWPLTTEGRILCLVLSVYAVLLLGYIVALLASHFIGRDAEARPSAPESRDVVERLQKDVADLRIEIQNLSHALEAKALLSHEFAHMDEKS